MKEKNYEIGFVGLLFSIGIFVYNSMYLDAANGNPRIFAKGYLGVEFFFMVSGYLMAMSILKMKNNNIEMDHFQFVKRKAISLYPYFLIAYVLNFIVWNFVVDSRDLSDVIKSAVFSVGELSLLFTSGIKFTNHLIHGAAWYVSAMLIATFVLFPIMKKDLKKFTAYIAPVISLFCYGFLSNNVKQLSSYDKWLYFATEGVLRAFAGLSLGAVVFAVCQSIEKSDRRLSGFGTYAVSAVEIVIPVTICVLMGYRKVSEFEISVDFMVITLSFLLLIIIFSKAGRFHKVFSNKVFGWLSKLALPLYFSHRVWTRFISAVFPEMNFIPMFALYTVLSFATAALMIPAARLVEITGKSLKDKLIAEKRADASERQTDVAKGE